MSLIPHNQAKNRYHFTGVLTLETGLHVGSGRGNFETDALIVKNLDGTPLIPGSSLRGVFRSYVERTLNGLHDLGVLPQLWSCQLFETDLGDNICVGSQSHEKSKQKAEELTDKVEKQGLDAIWECLESNLCTTCQLFGAGSFWASKLRIADLPILEGQDSPTQIRHGVGIHRDTGTAANQVKFDQEVLDSGVRFGFDMVGENLTETDMLLISLGLSEMMSGGMRIGGNTSRGLGVVKLSGSDQSVQHVNFEDQSALITYLTNHQFPDRQTFEAFIDQHLSFEAGEGDDA
jgi:CRISPR-associated RAMP protein (TIGR02581 family)